MAVRATADDASFMRPSASLVGSEWPPSSAGSYLAYGIGLRHRISKWQQRPLRVMNS